MKRFVYFYLFVVAVSAVFSISDYDGLDTHYIPTAQDYEDLMLEQLYSSLLDDKTYDKLKPAEIDYSEPNDDIYSSQPEIESPRHESLPFYCPPPNPCPKGLTAEDGCDEQIQDTEYVQKAWINNLMENGYCDCDQEHMFSCSKKSSIGLGGMLGSVMQDEDKMSQFSQLDKLPVVAKKSPRFKRSLTRSMMLNYKRTQLKRTNPYLQGPNLGVVAKKGVIFH